MTRASFHEFFFQWISLLRRLQASISSKLTKKFHLITELKKDVESAKLLGTAAAAAAAAHHHQHAQPAHHHHHHKGFIGTMAEMSLLQKKADEYHKSISAND